MASSQTIYFKVDTFPIISEILKNTQIEESDEDIIEKLSSNKPLQGEVIIKAVEKIVLDGAKEKDVCSFLESELGVPTTTAKIVYAEISKKLVPEAKKEAVKKEDAPAQKISLPTEEAPLFSEIKTTNQPNKSNEPDKYRESIS